ncbi:RHS repeat-associated core domain-containing protein [Phaeocystidibacter marisrubri]|uniref:RHS repeat-associated core domain-containing protein n=1 Tax=Phaeocystidibacter marisrubri TaxID=1577780 RepID=A0A6L3ZGZ8_9FLAO|nr:RHS repeat-associated core domain-containing protein [Phaeocystidibacter marisrubri]KAB2816604.1 hypothetical protein F8C82_13055 [Phaeocystidibacter marisrubri]GGH69893.1 hypothetical protein GCM10011318_11390 [Phaeocystidibacter marisrubri]
MVTNKQGIVHQFFLTNLWGENMHTYNQPTPGFDGPYRFNDDGVRSTASIERCARSAELEQETGYAYYGARYYDNQLSIWLSVDLLAHKYPRVSGYVFSNNNPLAFVDPDGNENIVVVGSQNAAGAGNKLMFVNQGIRAMREWSESSSQSAESRTMVLFTGGYTEDQIARIRSSVEGYGGSLVTVNSVDEMTSYINSKSTSCADLSDDRLSDKVTDMEMYSHGVPGAVEFGYGTENADKYRLDGSNVRDLNSGSFNGTESNISSFACRTAMGTNFSVVGSTFFIDREGSLAQGISNATGASVMAFPVRTDYQFTLGTWSERRFGIPNAAPEMQTIDGAVFTPHGAAHPVQPGSTPFGVYQGELFFSPQ